MFEKKSCPQCEAVTNVELVAREEYVKMKGQNISFTACSYRCTECNEEFDTPETLDQNLEVAREEYARVTRTPTPVELVALRQRYGASQKAFALLLGFGETTINSYEKGNTPDSTNRLLLKLAQHPEVFRLIYNENKYKIGTTQRKRIEASDGFSKSTISQENRQEQWKQFVKIPLVSQTAVPESAPSYKEINVTQHFGGESTQLERAS